jgi:hypothetical protein
MIADLIYFCCLLRGDCGGDSSHDLGRSVFNQLIAWK